MFVHGNTRIREVKKTSTDPIKRNNNTKINGLHEIPTENTNRNGSISGMKKKI